MAIWVLIFAEDNADKARAAKIAMMLMTTSNSTSVKPSRNPNRLEVLFIRNSQFRTFYRENHNHPAARLLQEAKLCLSVYQTEWRLAASSETDSRCPRVTSL